jgi:hypothetical protein
MVPGTDSLACTSLVVLSIGSDVNLTSLPVQNPVVKGDFEPTVMS